MTTNFKDFKITVFQDNTHIDKYFDKVGEAVEYGSKRAKSPFVNAVFLLSRIGNTINYDVECQL